MLLKVFCCCFVVVCVCVLCCVVLFCFCVCVLFLFTFFMCHRGAVYCVLLFWLQIFIGRFALFHHSVFDYNVLQMR